jgi:hypothetical protein
MALPGYAYSPSVLRQHSPQVTTSAAPAPAQRPSGLTGESLRLLVKLGPKVDLRELSERFPRVLNRIAEVWNKPQQADRCFDELLLYSRGVRQGFPQSVISEIAALRRYHLTRMFPKRADRLEQAVVR